MNTEWKPVNALRDSLLWTASSLAAIGKEQDVITLEGRKRTVGEILDEANEALNVPDDAAPTSHPIPTGATGEDGEKVYHFEQRSKFGPWIEVEKPTAKSVEFVKRPAPAAGDARKPGIDIEAAAQKMAECMDYPWAHMPEQGRTHMRKFAQSVIDAAIAQQKGEA
jgi:hypothetical protein